MKVLVTGATGFVGSTLTRQLVREGRDVRLFRRESASLDLLQETSGEVEHFFGDLLDPNALFEAMRGVDQVFHTAAYVGFGGRSERDLLFRVNVAGTAAVVDAALRVGVRRLVHTSSMAAFGRHPDVGLIDERTEWRPSRENSEYARSKYLSELEVHRAIEEGLDAVIVNPALIFGVGRPGQNTRRIVDLVRAGRLPGIPPGGTNVVDVLDVAAGMIRAMDGGRSGERYFLGSQNLPWKTIIETLAHSFGVSPPSRVVSPRMAMALAAGSEAIAFVARRQPLLSFETVRTAVRQYRYDNSKAVRELGCRFRTFDETAHRIAAALQPE